MKYMVMECHLSYAVVLDEQGKFLKVANLHYEVGQTVTDIVEMRQPEQQTTKKRSKQWIYSLAAMAACLLLTITSVFQMGQTTYGSVYLTINPQVRIDVNRKDVVVGLKGNNEDGNALIADYSYKRKNLNTVMDELVQRAIDMGYLHKGGQITLTLDADDDQWVVSHGDALSTQLNKSLTESLNVTITVTDRNSKTHEVIIPVTPDESTSGNSGPGVSGQPDDRDREDSSASKAPPAPPISQGPSYEESDYGASDYGDPDDDTSEDDDMDDDEPGYEDLDNDDADDDSDDDTDNDDTDDDDTDNADTGNDDTDDDTGGSDPDDDDTDDDSGDDDPDDNNSEEQPDPDDSDDNQPGEDTDDDDSGDDRDDESSDEDPESDEEDNDD